MADWYVSSAAYALIAVWQASHAYSIGDIIAPTAPAQTTHYVFRCTTAGTSGGTEPSWNGAAANNNTIASGTATFTNVTGQSAYFWAAATGDLQTLNGTFSTNRFAAGDRVFISSDHTETTTTGSYGSGGSIANGYGLLQFLCVNRAGSTPPVAADLTTGATFNASNAPFLYHRVNVYSYGIKYVQSGAGTQQITFNDSTSNPNKTGYYQNCQFVLNAAAASSINANNIKIVFDNTTVQFGNAGQKFACSNVDFTWQNTASAIAGTAPTVLFSGPAVNLTHHVVCRGADLSAITGTVFSDTGGAAFRYLFDSCKIASAATRYSNASGANTTDIVEFVNCYDGTNIISERYAAAGTLSTERTITLSGGATDDVGTFAHKLVSTANVDKFANRFESFWLDVENTAIGSSKTATVEIISSTALNNDEISLELEYQGTASSSLASFANSLPATVLTAAAAVTTSSATWNSSPATPQKQKLQVTFTPQVAGRVRGLVRLGKASATVYVNPQIAIT